MAALTRVTCSILVTLIACGGGKHASSPQQATQVALPSDPATARYAVPARVGDLVVDDAAFAAFARDVRRDAETAVRRASDAEVRSHLFVLAMLDALDDRWPAAIEKLDRIRAVERDPVKAAMIGLSIRVGADARAEGAPTNERYAAALERVLDALPLDRVRDELAMLRAMGQAFTPEACRSMVDDAVGPHVSAGTVGIEHVQTIVFQRYAAVELSRFGSVIDRVLAARGIGLPGAP